MQNSEGICALTQNSCKWDYIFLQRSQTAETASIKLLLKPEASSAATAAMVVPPGEQTLSLRTPGCSPVSRTILAEPKTAWATNV